MALRNDSISKILSENSNLTKTQLETLLIDVLVENVFDIDINYEKKAGLRILGVTRGAFNRTLRQARTNVIKSIYTILLLGYLGMFDDCRLYPYLEISNKLQKFMNTYKKGHIEKTKMLRRIGDVAVVAGWSVKHNCVRIDHSLASERVRFEVVGLASRAHEAPWKKLHSAVLALHTRQSVSLLL